MAKMIGLLRRNSVWKGIEWLRILLRLVKKLIESLADFKGMIRFIAESGQRIQGSMVQRRGNWCE